MSSTVQDALEYYVAEYQWLAAETPRLDEVRGRLPASVTSLADRHQLEQYSREATAFDDRVDRFEQSRAPS